MAQLTDLTPLQLMTYFLLNAFVPEGKPLFLKNKEGKTASFLIYPAFPEHPPGTMPPSATNEQLMGAFLFAGISNWLEHPQATPTDYVGANDSLSIINHCVSPEKGGGTLAALRRIFKSSYDLWWGNTDIYFIIFAAYHTLCAELAKQSFFINESELKEGGNFAGDKTAIIWGKNMNTNMAVVTILDDESLERLFVYHRNFDQLARERFNELTLELDSHKCSNGELSRIAWPSDIPENAPHLILSNGRPVGMRKPPSEQGIQYYAGLELLIIEDGLYIRPAGGLPNQVVEQTDFSQLIAFIRSLIGKHKTIFGEKAKLFENTIKILATRGISQENPLITINFFMMIIGAFWVNTLKDDAIYEKFYKAALSQPSSNSILTSLGLASFDSGLLPDLQNPDAFFAHLAEPMVKIADTGFREDMNTSIVREITALTNDISLGEVMRLLSSEQTSREVATAQVSVRSFFTRDRSSPSETQKSAESKLTC